MIIFAIISQITFHQQILKPILIRFKILHQLLKILKIPSSAPNASSLFCAPLTLRLKTTRAGVCVSSFHELANPFSLKSAVKADFLTLELNITAGTNKLTSNSKQETNNAGVSVGNNAVQVSVGHSEGESDYEKTFYTNSQIKSENGTTILTSGNDTNISGANLLTKDMILNVGNNLNVESKQTQEDSSSSGFGFNAGFGVGSGGGGSVSLGFNMNNSEMTRTWTDDITTLIATGAMQVNVGKDLNLTGAAILSDNMLLNVAGNINKTDLQDNYYSESMSLGMQANVGFGGKGSGTGAAGAGTAGAAGSAGTVATASNSGIATNNAIGSGANGQGQSPAKTAPSGSVSINGSYSENEAKRTVYATIGGLNSTLFSETKTMIGGDFEGGLTVDLRLFTTKGRESIKSDFNNLDTNVKIVGYAAGNTVVNGVQSLFGDNKGASVVDTFKAKQTEQVVALQRALNPLARLIINNLGNKEQSASNIQNALAVGQEPGAGATVYYDKDADESGFYDKSTGGRYINLATGTTSDVTNATNTNSLLFTDGHERGHLTSSNEGFADMVGNEANTAWGAANWIYGDRINTNQNVTSNSWANYNGVGSAPITSYNQFVQSSVLHFNNRVASGVAKDDRDNFIPLIPLAYTLVATILTNEAFKITRRWKSRGWCL